MSEDFFRDTWVRYLGYANEVGEAFRSVVPPQVVRLSYTVAFGYVLADTADKALKMFWKDGRPNKVVMEMGDALLWQTLASIIIPGFTINRICAASQKLLNTRCKWPPLAKSVITVGVGLASIPIIVHPIDAGVTVFMDNTYRRFLHSNK